MLPAMALKKVRIIIIIRNGAVDEAKLQAAGAVSWKRAKNDAGEGAVAWARMGKCEWVGAPVGSWNRTCHGNLVITPMMSQPLITLQQTSDAPALLRHLPPLTD